MTAQPNIATLADALAPHAEHLADLTRAIADLTAQADEVKATIRSIVATHGPGTYGSGRYTVGVSLNRRLDLEALARKYPATLRPDLYRLTPDPSAVRKALPPVVLEEFMSEVGEPRITVKEA